MKKEPINKWQKKGVEAEKENPDFAEYLKGVGEFYKRFDVAADMKDKMERVDRVGGLLSVPVDFVTNEEDRYHAILNIDGMQVVIRRNNISKLRDHMTRWLEASMPSDAAPGDGERET